MCVSNELWAVDLIEMANISHLQVFEFYNNMSSVLGRAIDKISPFTAYHTWYDTIFEYVRMCGQPHRPQFDGHHIFSVWNMANDCLGFVVCTSYIYTVDPTDCPPIHLEIIEPYRYTAIRSDDGVGHHFKDHRQFANIGKSQQIFGTKQNFLPLAINEQLNTTHRHTQYDAMYFIIVIYIYIYACLLCHTMLSCRHTRANRLGPEDAVSIVECSW